MITKVNVCMSCGACCAYYRASFYWAETNDVAEGGVPVHLTEKLNNFRLVMLGTSGSKPRCIALKGAIGAEVRCMIYPMRASICRDFAASWEGDTVNERCDKARQAWGLLPLRPDSFVNPENFPKAA